VPPPKGSDSLEALLNRGQGAPTPARGSRMQALGPQRLPLSRGRELSNGYSKPAQLEMDFDDEARKLWARLNLDPSIVSSGPYNALDALWQHPQSRGIFYVGNQQAASNLALLREYNITHVVNCTDNMPNYHERTSGSNITYYRFDITSSYRRVKSDAEAVQFVQPMLDFVGTALAEGHNVMVHCLAGAHRAGTTGCICLMHFASLGNREAVTTAKRCRPIIDPIGHFPELLAKLDRGWKASPSQR